MLTNQLKTINQQVFTFVTISVFQMLSSHFEMKAFIKFIQKFRIRNFI